MVFVGVHVVSLVADSYVHFGPTEILVPLASSWHPVAVAWGIISMYLLVAVEVTSLLRRHLSRRLWRMTHFLSFPLFATATIHLLFAGTERHNPVLLLVVAAVVVAVAVLTALRVQAGRRAAPTAGAGRVPAALRSPAHPAGTRLPTAGAAQWSAPAGWPTTPPVRPPSIDRAAAGAGSTRS